MSILDFAYQFVLPALPLLPLVGVCWWPCCPPPVDCTVATNDFATYSGFTTVSGSWSASGALTTTDTNAITLCNTDPPSDYYKLNVKIYGAGTGDRNRIYLHYLDSTHYNVIEIRNNRLRLDKRNGGAEFSGVDVSITRTNATWYDVEICVFQTGGLTKVVVRFNNGVSLANSVTAYGDKVGLGSGASGTSGVWFDDFVLTDASGDCPPCNSRVYCGSDNLPHRLAVYFPGVSNTNCNCSSYSGMTVYVDYYSGCNWDGCASATVPYKPGATCLNWYLHLKVILNRNVSGFGGWRLELWSSSSDPSDDPCTTLSGDGGGLSGGGLVSNMWPASFSTIGTSSDWNNWAAGDTRYLTVFSPRTVECDIPAGSPVEITPVAS